MNPSVNYRPNPTGNRLTDEALRIAFDYIYQLRNTTSTHTTTETVKTITQSTITAILASSAPPAVPPIILFGPLATRLPVVAEGTVWITTDTSPLAAYLFAGGVWVLLTGDYVTGAPNLTHPNHVAKVLSAGVITEAAFLDSDVTLGAPNLTHANRVTKVSSAGTVTEAAFFDSDVVLGAPNLTHAGALLKTYSSGTATESAVSDDGTNVTSSEPVVVNITNASQVTQFLTTSSGLGAAGIRCVAANNAQILMDLYAAGGVNIAADTTVARIQKSAGLLKFQRAFGQTVGVDIGPNIFTAIALDLTSGYTGFGGNVTPNYPVDVTGDINTSTAYRVNGALLSGKDFTCSSISSTNRSSTYATTNLTVGGGIAPAGMYRVSIYVATRTAGSGSVALAVGWNDGIGAKSLGPSMNLTAGNTTTVTLNLATSGVSNITVTATYAATGAYDIYAALERIA